MLTASEAKARVREITSARLNLVIDQRLRALRSEYALFYEQAAEQIQKAVEEGVSGTLLESDTSVGASACRQKLAEDLRELGYGVDVEILDFNRQVFRLPVSW